MILAKAAFFIGPSGNASAQAKAFFTSSNPAFAKISSSARDRSLGEPIAAAPANSETISDLSDPSTDCHFGSSLSPSPRVACATSTSAELAGFDGAVTRPTPNPTTTATPTDPTKGAIPPNKPPEMGEFIPLS